MIGNISTNLAKEVEGALRMAGAKPQHVMATKAGTPQKPGIVAMRSDCCGSNNYENKRIVHA